MVRATVIFALLSCAGLAAAKPYVYDTITAVADPAYGHFDAMVKEFVSTYKCAVDDSIFNANFRACKWQWVEDLAAGKPYNKISPVKCTAQCANQWSKITQGCFRQFRSNMEKDPVYGPGATLFFDQCDSLKVQAASLDEIKGKPASLTVPGSVSSASIQPAQVIRPATPVVDEPLVAAADMAEPPAAEPVPEGGVTGELVAGTVIEAAKAKNLTQLLGLWGEACGLGEDAGQSEVGLTNAFGADFNGTVFAPTDAAFKALLDNAAVLGVNITDEMLLTVLMYHVSSEYLLAVDLTEGLVVPTEADKDLTVILTPDGGVTLKAVGNTATVVEPDLKVGQAVVHVIDAVLLPFAPPVATPEAPPGVEAQPVSGAASTVASLAALAASVLAAVLMM